MDSPAIPEADAHAFAILALALERPRSRAHLHLAAKLLSEIPQDRVISHILHRRSLGDVGTLATLFSYLGRYDRLDTVRPLAKAARESIAIAALSAIGELGNQEDLNGLILMGEGDAASPRMTEARRQAIQKLRVFAKLKKQLWNAALTAEDEACIRLGLGKESPSADWPLLASIAAGKGSFGEAAQQRLLSVGSACADSVIQTIGACEADAPEFCFRYLSSIRDPRLAHFVECALASGRDVPQGALETYAEIADDDSIRALAVAIVTLREHSRESVRNALAFLGSRRSDVGEIFANEYRRERHVRRSEAVLLAKLLGTRSLPLLVTAMRDPLRIVRSNAQLGIATLDDASASLIALHMLTEKGGSIAKDLLSLFGVNDETQHSLLAVVHQENESWLFDKESLTTTISTALLKNDVSDFRLFEKALAAAAAAGAAALPLLRTLAHHSDSKVRQVVRASVRNIGHLGPAERTLATSILITLETIEASARPRIIPSNRTDAFSGNEMLFSLRGTFGSDRDPEAVASRIPGPIKDYAQLSVTAPETVGKGAPFLLDVWLHQTADLDLVLTRAERMYRAAARHSMRGPVELERGTVLEVSVDIPDLNFSDSDGALWMGEVANTNFSISVPSDAKSGTCYGVARLAVHGVPIARLNFILEIATTTGKYKEDRTANAKWYSRAFASYASKDRDKVLGRIQGIQKVVPKLDIFVDVMSLRSGDDWKKRLKEEIELREVFLLFWSQAARDSMHVEYEWRTALSSKGIECIDPVPLEPPTSAPPPAELSSLHFNDAVLAFEA